MVEASDSWCLHGVTIEILESINASHLGPNVRRVFAPQTAGFREKSRHGRTPNGALDPVVHRTSSRPPRLAEKTGGSGDSG